MSPMYTDFASFNAVSSFLWFAIFLHFISKLVLYIWESVSSWFVVSYDGWVIVMQIIISMFQIEHFTVSRDVTSL